MLQHYYIRPTTIDRVRASWIGEPIEQYVAWLTEQNYAARNVFLRVPILLHFGQFARDRGATEWSQLPEYIEPFVDHWLEEHGKKDRDGLERKVAVRALRNPI